MRRAIILALAGIAWNASVGLPTAFENESLPAGAVKRVEDTNSTVITATQLSFDQQTRRAVFNENVVVTDREIKIKADKLEVFFTEDKKVDRIEAEGKVIISRDDLTAMSDKAAYDIKEGKMQLTGNPRIKRDQDTLTGETITLWRNSRRILCEPNARLVIASEQEVNRSFNK